MWALFLFLAAILVGCTPPETRGGRFPPNPVARVVSLSPSTTEIVMQFAEGTLLGRTAACDYPDTVKSIPVVMSGIKPSAEKLIAYKPQLIVYDKSLFNAADEAELKKVTGAELMPMDATTLEGSYDWMYRFAARTGVESRVSEYIDKIEASRNRYKSAMPQPGPKVAFVMGGSGTEYMLAGTSGFLGNLLKSMGAQPIGPSGKIFEPVNMESLLAWNPDVVIVAGKKESEAFYKDPRVQTLSAVKNKRVAGVDASMMLRVGSRLDTFVRIVGQFTSGENK